MQELTGPPGSNFVALECSTPVPRSRSTSHQLTQLSLVSEYITLIAPYDRFSALQVLVISSGCRDGEVDGAWCFLIHVGTSFCYYNAGC